MTVFERDRVASGASGAAVGALQPLLGMRLSLRDRNLEGFAKTSQLVRDLLVEDRTWRQPGVLRLSVRPDQVERWRTNFAGLPKGLAQWREPAECRAVEPRLKESILAGVWIEDGKFVDIPAFIEALLSHADATVYEHLGVQEVERAGSGLTLVLDNGERTDFDAVVICSGAQAPAPLRGEVLELAPYMGILAAFGGIEPPAVALNHRGYISAWRDGAVLVGTVDRRPPFANEPTDATVAELRARLNEVLSDCEDARLLKVWKGLRPAMLDREPVVQRSMTMGAAWIFSGFGGRGLLLGPMLAEELAAEMCAG